MEIFNLTLSLVTVCGMMSALAGVGGGMDTASRK